MGRGGNLLYQQQSLVSNDISHLQDRFQQAVDNEEWLTIVAATLTGISPKLRYQKREQLADWIGGRLETVIYQTSLRQLERMHPQLDTLLEFSSQVGIKGSFSYPKIIKQMIDKQYLGALTRNLTYIYQHAELPQGRIMIFNRNNLRSSKQPIKVHLRAAGGGYACKLSRNSQIQFIHELAINPRERANYHSIICQECESCENVGYEKLPLITFLNVLSQAIEKEVTNNLQAPLTDSAAKVIEERLGVSLPLIAEQDLAESDQAVIDGLPIKARNITKQ